MVNCILSWSFVGMNLSIAAITSDLKLTHMSFTGMWLWSDERNVSLIRARWSRRPSMSTGFLSYQQKYLGS